MEGNIYGMDGDRNDRCDMEWIYMDVYHDIWNGR